MVVLYLVKLLKYIENSYSNKKLIKLKIIKLIIDEFIKNIIIYNNIILKL